MRLLALFVIVVAVVSATTYASPACATAQRTFVSTSGNDANPCSLAQPCRSFAAALGETDPDGEIVVLDSGGYGPVTIAQSVAIIAPTGVHAGISVFSGTYGVDIATAGVTVVLRGLTITGQGGNRGISMTQGTQLHVEHCVISGLPTGIHLAATGSAATILDTVVRDGGVGLRASGSVNVTADRLRVSANTSNGVSASNGATVVVRDSVLSSNGSAGVEATGDTTSTTRLVAERVTAVGNAFAGVRLRAESGAIGSAHVIAQVTGSTLSGNQYGIYAYNLNGNFLDVTMADSVLADNTASGLHVISGGSNGRVTAVGNRITDNGIGIRLITNAVLRTAGDNIVDRNATNTQFDPGTTVTPVGGT